VGVEDVGILPEVQPLGDPGLQAGLGRPGAHGAVDRRLEGRGERGAARAVGPVDQVGQPVAVRIAAGVSGDPAERLPVQAGAGARLAEAEHLDLLDPDVHPLRLETAIDFLHGLERPGISFLGRGGERHEQGRRHQPSHRIPAHSHLSFQYPNRGSDNVKGTSP
jgi:hypothetical protein